MLARATVFIVMTVAIFALLIAAWFALILATGGSLTECDRGDCGTLGEFSVNTSPLMPVVFLAVAVMISWFVGRRASHR